ncbi:MAG: ATP-binding protein [Deltaproteobacteria bacterium]
MKDMRSKYWLFRKLNLNLRVEIIINISLLMLVAILLIGFSISKINEKNIIQEKIRNGEGMVKDVQAIIDFMSQGKKEFSLSLPETKRAIQDFVRIYTKERGFLDLIILDTDMNVITSKKAELIGKPYANDLMKKAIEFGHSNTEIEKSGNILSVEYKTLILYSPLYVQGKIAGGIQMEVPIGDVMDHLLRSQRMVLVSIILDALVLIVFGSFLLSRVLVKPLKDLVQLTQKISEGDFSRKIEVTSKNEIGQLITSFNRMIDRLKENQENLENHLQSLESKNKQLKQTQEELIRTEKLASIGRFAAGVAHEVGNPLGAILGYTHILQKEGVDREEARDYLKRIEKEIERINRIVRELLDYARPSKFEIREVDVNKVVENTLSLLSYQKNFRNIETQLELQLDLPAMMGDESQLSQVFINIVLNAIDAMPTGGTLRIRTEEYLIENAYADPMPLLGPPRRKGDPDESDYSHIRKLNPLSVMLMKFSRGDRVVKARISDTGVGIKKEDLERIFDPFFTTKDPDKGTGLGLSISLRIVESMGGEMRVESEVGKGSAFELYFPMA